MGSHWITIPHHQTDQKNAKIVSKYELFLDSRAISPWPIGPRTLGPRTLSPWHIKSQGPKGRGPNVPRTSGPWPQGPIDLRYHGLKVRGPMGRRLFHCFLLFLELY